MSATVVERRSERRAFYRMTFRLTMPIVLQNVLDTAVNMADVLMLTLVSQTALSASSLAGQVQFVLSMIFYGLTGGTAIMTAQYWGKGDTRTIEKVMAIGVRMTFGISLVFALAAWLAPDGLMMIFTLPAGFSTVVDVPVASVVAGSPPTALRLEPTAKP